MGEGAIIQLQFNYLIWLGFGIRPIIINGKKIIELSIYLPFIFLSIQIKKKTNKNDWFKLYR